MKKRPFRWLPATRKGRRRTVQAVMAACVLAVLPVTWVHAAAESRLWQADDVPPAPVAIVFGAGLWQGKPSPYLAHRLDTAVDLYRAGKVRVVLVTGDNGRRKYNEPDAMRAYLRERGVPDDRVVADYAGFDTWDSCTRARRVFGVRKAVLVTQDFHIRRAVALCDAAGIDAYGVAVEARRDRTWYAAGAREILAAGKAAMDAAVRPGPRFLGPHEPGVERALRAAER
ncbi:SanA/YdcF family protein [Streptomyces sp. URMC 126]|uniref:SanA/YdcF family protein n=1 Tax=Streptomyces sp. URMC 126 TaxID=3423401 RepID=UPI003F1D78F5